MAISAGPIGTGLAASLARPGGNVTGLTLQAADLSAKRLQLFKEVIPKAFRIAVWNAAHPGKAVEFRETQAAARVLGASVRSVEIRAASDLTNILSGIAATNPDALVVLADPLTNTHRKAIVDFALKNHLPMMSEIRPFAEEGGLVTYGPSMLDMCRRAAIYVDKIRFSRGRSLPTCRSSNP